MFKKILIANRGEIACRIIRSAKKMGIATVAVYSEADQTALHVELADEAVCIGQAASKESYLRTDKIIEACQKTGAEAVHPGYGFLSENEAFARTLEEAGIIFIGPKHEAIAAMGDKIASKRLAAAVGVSTIPGHDEAIASVEEAVKIAAKIGYPVMIKASAGGGGKGLRVAYNDKEAGEGFQSCRNEAANAFGDDRIFIEKFVEQPRHIEIQVLADSFGNTVYLNERECSIQRRHQKVVEEAPSPFISATTRQAMGRQAVALAQAVNYQSAGTVEFVVGKDQSFYFLEMNTRLQVEHPVTEFITGLDLVEQMIRIAAGERLPISQKDVKINGWAMECRINAEDPLRGFLPSIGRLIRFCPPRESANVRVDTGVYEGGEISVYYDSMIAKLITYGNNRQEAIMAMRQALNAFTIRGIASNIPFQAALMHNPRFVAGDFTTGFIGENYAQGFAYDEVAAPAEMLAIAAALHRRYLDRAAQISGQLPSHEREVRESYVVVDSGRETKVEVLGLADENYQASVDGQDFALAFDWTFGDLLLRVRINGAKCLLQVDRKALVYQFEYDGKRHRLQVFTPFGASCQRWMPMKVVPDLSRLLMSPMPGLLRELAVVAGQQVQAGDKLVVIEAMKMENVLCAERPAKVAKVAVAVGDSLRVDQILLEFE